MNKSIFRWIAAFCLFLPACKQTNTDMQDVKSGQVNINYQMSGKGPVTLLFLHGSYIDQSYWKKQVEYFGPRFRVVTMDLPGHGQSGHNRSDWTVAGFGRDVVALLDQLNLHDVVLIGHSMGGDVALEAAVERPERVVGFIAVDFFKNAATPIPDQEGQVGKIMARMRADFPNANEQYARMALLTAQTDSSVTQRVVNDYRNAYQPMGLPLMDDIFQYYKREKILLPQLRRKLYLVNVDYFPTNEAPLKEYAGSGYELVTMHGTSHYPMLENPAELNRLLEQTIEKIIVSR